MSFVRLILLLAAISGFSIAPGQTRIDSLENELSKDLPDSAKVGLLVALSQEYQYADFSKSKEYAEKALALTEGPDLSRNKARAYKNVANLYTLSGDYSSALRYDELALKQSLSLGDSLSITIDYNNIANDYLDLGEYDEAYYFFTQSHRLATAIGDSPCE